MTYGAIAQMPVLWADDAWMTLAVIRTREMQSIENGYPQSLVHYLRWLRQQTQHGFTLVLNEEPTLCTIAQISLVADADGLRLLTGCKGSSALKPCFLCQNVLNGHDKVQNHVHISCCDVHACHLQTQDNLIHIQRHLETLLSRKEREEAEKLLGWHLHALSASILVQEDLRNWIPLSSLRYDAMHCFLANCLKNWGSGIMLFWTRPPATSIQYADTFCNAGQPPKSRAWTSTKFSQRKDGRTKETSAEMHLKLCQCYL